MCFLILPRKITRDANVHLRFSSLETLLGKERVHSPEKRLMLEVPSTISLQFLPAIAAPGTKAKLPSLGPLSFHRLFSLARHLARLQTQ